MLTISGVSAESCLVALQVVDCLQDSTMETEEVGHLKDGDKLADAAHIEEEAPWYLNLNVWKFW